MLRRSVPQISRYLFRQLRGHYMQVTANALAGCLLVLADLSFVWATKLTIDIATRRSDAMPLAWGFALLAAIMAARLLLTLGLRWVRAILGVRAQNDMRAEMFRRLLGVRWDALRAYHTGNLTNRVERDVADVVNFVTESLPALVKTTLQFAGAFAFLFIMNRQLATVVVLIVPFFLLASKLYVKRMRELTRQARESDSAIQSTIQETLQHSLVVKTLRAAKPLLARLNGQQTALHRLILRRTRYSTVSTALLNTGFSLGYLVTFVWGVTGLSRGEITYGAMIAFIQLVGQIQDPVRQLSRFVPIFVTAFTASERLMDIESLPTEDGGAALRLPGTLAVRMENVTFAYEPGSREIFSGFSHTFPAGGITAIVGETGAGKTTLIRLLLALCRPQKGTVSLVGDDGKSVPVGAALRCNFSYVPQGNSLFSGTVRSNLLLAAPDATEAQMVGALRTAAADFVLSRPAGLDTPCGESGDGLSEGQAQRIAIARALLGSGGVLIFDEATSSLDGETEETVLRNIVKAYPHRTLIFITHRPAVLQYATATLRL